MQPRTVVQGDQPSLPASFGATRKRVTAAELVAKPPRQKRAKLDVQGTNSTLPSVLAYVTQQPIKSARAPPNEVIELCSDEDAQDEPKMVKYLPTKRKHTIQAAIDLTQSDDDDEMVESTSVSLSGACSPVRKTGEEQDVHMAAVEAVEATQTIPSSQSLTTKIAATTLNLSAAVSRPTVSGPSSQPAPMPSVDKRVQDLPKTSDASTSLVAASRARNIVSPLSAEDMIKQLQSRQITKEQEESALDADRILHFLQTTLLFIPDCKAHRFDIYKAFTPAKEPIPPRSRTLDLLFVLLCLCSTDHPAERLEDPHFVTLWAKVWLVIVKVLHQLKGTASPYPFARRYLQTHYNCDVKIKNGTSAKASDIQGMLLKSLLTNGSIFRGPAPVMTEQDLRTTIDSLKPASTALTQAPMPSSSSSSSSLSVSSSPAGPTPERSPGNNLSLDPKSSENSALSRSAYQVIGSGHDWFKIPSTPSWQEPADLSQAQRMLFDHIKSGLLQEGRYTEPEITELAARPQTWFKDNKRKYIIALLSAKVSCLPVNLINELAVKRNYTSTPPSSRLAFVAHPFGKLGGTWNDPVVQLVTRTLLEIGWNVVNYNARGVGKSSGSGSFSCLPEANDYQAIVDHYCELSTPSELLFAGYSAGSLPPILCRASPNVSSVRVRRLLTSYPLSVLWALTLFRSSTFISGLERLVAEGQEVMLVHGTSDTFTGISKYRERVEGLKKLSQNPDKLHVVEIEGADHFYSSHSSELTTSIEQWLRL